MTAARCVVEALRVELAEQIARGEGPACPILFALHFASGFAALEAVLPSEPPNPLREMAARYELSNLIDDARFSDEVPHLDPATPEELEARAVRAAHDDACPLCGELDALEHPPLLGRIGVYRCRACGSEVSAKRRMQAIIDRQDDERARAARAKRREENPSLPLKVLPHELPDTGRHRMPRAELRDRRRRERDQRRWARSIHR
jgi:hypothetical protein